MSNQPQPWDHQSGGDTYYVVFNGSVFSNAWWVEAHQCPGDADKDPNNNPWRLQRAATQEEIAKGNPTNCG
ncbi:hypothetical protein ACFY2W_23315 [Streptomyces sp. NPDC001262]|uniref:hypothetical protein n=1 Tax=Streptomyces sp. NPDC001262 TaxID=3364552 RepID=UPI0036A767DF